MKKKILNWIYDICRKILATGQKQHPYIIINKENVEFHKIDVCVPDKQILQSNANLLEFIHSDMKIHLLKICETKIKWEKRRDVDGLSTIHTASIYTIKSNGTNK